MEELISIIVPVYNVEQYLAYCLDSIIEQSYKRLEIILVDDGSTDGSGNICREYAGKDSRIKLISQQNGGLSAARNAGIVMSTGTCIAFIDSDDFIDKSYIQTMYTALIQSGSDMVCCEFFCFADGREADVRRWWKEETVHGGSFQTFEKAEMLEKALYQHISVTGAQQKLYRRTVLEGIAFPEGRIYEDLATTYQFILKTAHVSVIDEKLYAYRIRSNSIMNETFSDRKLDCVWVAEKLYSDIVKMAPQLSKAAACACFRVNRLVLYQIPYKEKTKKDMVWAEIKKYRKIVLTDTDAQIYERMLALGSYSGSTLFAVILKTFQFLRNLRIRLMIR